MSEVDVTEAMRRFITSDGDYCDFLVEGIDKGDSDDSDYKALGFDGTQLLADNRVVKTHMTMRLGKEEFQGEIYVTFVNFPPGKPFERRFFSLWTILNREMFKESTPLQWTPAPAPKVLLENSQLGWMLKVITWQNGNPYVNTRAARRKFATTPVEDRQADEPAADTATETAPIIPEATATATAESETVCENASANVAEDPAALIASLQEQLEECKSDYEELSEKNDQLVAANRELKKDKKLLAQNVEVQKSRLKALKKRAESAEARAREATNGDVREFCEYFDKERKRLETEGEEKDERIRSLQQELDLAMGEIASLKGRLNKQSSGNGISGLLAAPDNETEKYADEFGIAILSALHKAIEKTPTKNNSPHTRCIDVWQAIINANADLEKAFEQFCDDKEALKNAIVCGELDKKKHLLSPFNLTYGKHNNCHGKITFGSDERYIASTASTASETAAGFSNCAKDLRNTFLFPT